VGLKLWRCQKSWADDVQTVADSDTLHGLQLLGPADHGKTSRVVIPLPLWLWARDRSNRIGLIGNTDSYIQQLSLSVMRHVETNSNLRQFGLAKGDKWSVEEMKIERQDLTTKDPSLLSIGAGGEIQSQRFDYIITDDLYTRRNSATQSMRDKLNSYFETDLLSRLDKTGRSKGKGKTFMFGHRVEANDGYKHNLGRKDWLYRDYPAITNDVEQTVLCPEAHTYEDLAAHRSRDMMGFELMYQQRSAQMGTHITQTAMEAVRCPHLRFIQSRAQLKVEDFKVTWMSLDPAFSQKRWSSHAVWNLWGMTHEGKRRLLWAFRDKVSPESLLNISEMKFRLFMPDHFIIESNQGQILLLPYLKKKFPEHWSKFKGVNTDDGDGMLEENIRKVFDLYAAEPPMVEIPYAGVTEQAYFSAMMDEFCGYPNIRSRDTLMAQYVGEKGMGNLKDEARTARDFGRGGVLGRVVQTYKPGWRNW
jgi:hypothetical protein